MDYKNTINLPSTDFPMKASLPQKEPELLKRWESEKLYEKITASGHGKPKFILHDGPPYANGHIHIGTALNKILKDIIIKSKTMSGFATNYIPGWDCHGLPIEHNVEKQQGRARGTSQLETRKACRAYAEKFIAIQREEFKRLGVLGDWNNPYLTMSNGYTATIVREFGKFVAAGSVYKRKKPIQWCASCRTALAEAEVEYENHRSPSIYVKFPLVSDISTIIPQLAGKNVSVLIWTTTPWTIPANLAISLHPDFDYVAVAVDEDIYLIAEGLLERTMQECGIQQYAVIARCKGAQLERHSCKHPLYERQSLLILGTHVTLDAGTGCVHTAPGHGQEDYEIGLKYGLDIFAPVDDAGCFTAEVDHVAGQFVFDANKPINTMLAKSGALVAEREIEHSYPHCWRCKKPVIFRATEQWFISMEKNNLRTRAMECIERIQWIPRWGIDRISGMVINRPDWCLSRQRVWGVPIVAFYCTKCKGLLLDQKIINHVADLFEQEGSDIWFYREASQLVPNGTVCPHCGNTTFEKETDILDVWFDSGVSHAAVLEKRPELESPCDLYLEGSDQHRGWFQSSLLTCVGTRGRAPFRAVLTHGFVVDGKGEKMAKSKGNVISPDEVIRQYGAEVLRLWVASENYQEDMRISPDILKRLSEAYRKIRNTWRFMLGNLSDFDPAKDMVPYSDIHEIDRWALMRFNQLIRRVRAAYEQYEFHTVYHSIANFCITDMSAVYLDILKDRLYCSAAGSPERRAAQSTLYIILKGLLELLAPILSFTADEAWIYLPGEKAESVHLSSFPEVQAAYDDPSLAERWETLLRVRDIVLKQLEQARVGKLIGNSLEAAVRITAPPAITTLLEHYGNALADMFIVSRVELTRGHTAVAGSSEKQIDAVQAAVFRVGGNKCQRCWKYYTPGNPQICERCAAALQAS
ncbi:MAG: isoleucine--tRNA ligase [Desulfobacterota bacterium]|nr:isoleucine--tRNA ligase [Thermodesulfobacteriota bacterium]